MPLLNFRDNSRNAVSFLVPLHERPYNKGAYWEADWSQHAMRLVNHMKNKNLIKHVYAEAIMGALARLGKTRIRGAWRAPARPDYETTQDTGGAQDQTGRSEQEGFPARSSTP